MSKKSTLRRVLLPLSLMIGAMSIGAPGAQALVEYHYGGFPISAGYTYESGAASAEITGNIAAYTGGGSVSVCQRTYDLTSGVFREGCATNNVGNALNLMPYYGHVLFPMIKNNSAAKHTIHGWWYHS